MRGRTDRWITRKTNIQTEKHMYRQTNREMDRQKNIQMDILTEGWSDGGKMIERLIDEQTDVQTDSHLYSNILYHFAFFQYYNKTMFLYLDEVYFCCFIYKYTNITIKLKLN
jgi:hypothetical protein